MERRAFLRFFAIKEARAHRAILRAAVVDPARG
jgi:hypothetical protein